VLVVGCEGLGREHASGRRPTLTLSGRRTGGELNPDAQAGPLQRVVSDGPSAGPVLRTAVLMSNRHDEHVIFPDAVDDAERKPWDDSSPIRPAEGGACRRTVGGALNSPSTAAAKRTPNPLRRDS
jgi:hypothetical protein